MSTVTMSHPSFPLFTQLVCRLRQTNARYDQIAYQCRHTQRLTYHAKRRAYRVGLRINTSKARAAWLDDHIAVDRTAGSPLWVATETETAGDDSDSSAEDACLPNPWPQLKSLPEVVVRKQPVTVSLSPLGLELSNLDDVDTCDLPFRGPVPGAPRWRSKPLPEDECGMSLKDSVSIPFDVTVYGGLGITVPPRHLKRKLPDVDVDGSAAISRRRGVGCGVADDGFSGAWWSEAQRLRGGLQV